MRYKNSKIWEYTVSFKDKPVKKVYLINTLHPHQSRTNSSPSPGILGEKQEIPGGLPELPRTLPGEIPVLVRF
jgi:hypothetical protein